MPKVYKRRIFWFDTSFGCGALAVDQDGRIYEYDTAPIYRWMVGKKYVDMKNYLLKQNKLLNCKKIAVEEDPF